MSPPPRETRLSGTRVLKACDACKARKVRCSGGPAPCKRCIERKAVCHFSRMQVPRRQKVATELLFIDPPKPKEPEKASERPASAHNKKFHLPNIHVDRLLAGARSEMNSKEKPFTFKGNGLFGVNYGLSFFSDSRLLSLSGRLKNNKLQDLVRRISLVLQSRAKPTDTVSTGSLTRKRENLESFSDSKAAAKWIQIYFERIHPIYPFLDRESFEATTREKGFQELLKTNRAWSTLYHSVLALGCQHDGGGSFEPGHGQAWRLFSTSLALYPDLLAVPDSLVTVQALTAMAIYSSGISCLSIEHLIISEAARRVQRLVRTSLTGSTANSVHRTFWVLYSMEKISSFYLGRTSVFVDHDISCPIPYVPDSVFGDFDWLLTYARHSRLLSRALTSLFSSGVTGSPGTYYLDAIDQLNAELEDWRLSIPQDSRPGQTFKAHRIHEMLQGDATRQVILWTNYLYSGARIMLARATLHLAVGIEGLVPPARQASCKTHIMDESRSILELSKYIDAEPWTPLWIIAGVPVIALFNLFELVIFNPKHQETRGNLALLDVVGGYFSRLEYASHGSLPSSLVSEFAYIAREYFNNLQKPDAPRNNGAYHYQRQQISQMPEVNDNAAAAAAATALAADQIAVSGATLQAAPLIDANNISTAVPQVPDFPSSHVPMAPMDDGEVMTDGSPNSLSHLDGLNFPMTEEAFDMSSDDFLGTDVMDLFNYSIPGIDPLFFAQVFDVQGNQMGG